ncbi:uncharacterized protein PG998_014996 [Apiospora kogelbergensis]|uniref:uncharacterized protein n=1 Tax=Apiospora kogelbergensis TaxID=1337665 RepID=UPI00312EFA97
MSTPIAAMVHEPFGLSLSVMKIVTAFVIAYCFLLRPFYNLYLHPLHKFPGPKLWAASRTPNAWMTVSGRSAQTVLDLHRKYGDVIRTAPNELSYVRADVWREVMGHRKSGQSENEKDQVHFAMFSNSIIGASREDHSGVRRILSHGFSARRMLEQQPLIRHYVDLLFKRLRENSAGGSQPLNVMEWFNYTTFDIIGDLAFGEPFGCLASSKLHPWVALVFKTVKQGNTLAAGRQLSPLATEIVTFFMGNTVAGQLRQHWSLVCEKVAKRLSMTTERPDFIDSMTRKDKGNMTPEQIFENSNVLIIAGSETTATVMSFATYLLASHPHVMARATEEVRAAFRTESDIDLLNVQSLRYLLAVLDEAMRMYPAVPGSQPRITPPEGQVICGDFVPKNTLLGIWQGAIFRYPGNFALPDEFISERWLGEDPRFAGDKNEAFEPFSYGSRNCIGKNLAYSEMRMILARLLFNYDILLEEQSKGWAENMKIYLIWEKPGLWVRLVPRITARSE